MLRLRSEVEIKVVDDKNNEQRKSGLKDEGELGHGSILSSQGSVRGRYVGQKVEVEQVRNEVKYVEIDTTMEEWLARCAVGRLRDQLDLGLLKF